MFGEDRSIGQRRSHGGENALINSVSDFSQLNETQGPKGRALLF